GADSRDEHAAHAAARPWRHRCGDRDAADQPGGRTDPRADPRALPHPAVPQPPPASCCADRRGSGRDPDEHVDQVKEPLMEQMTLAGTELTAGRVVFGTMTFGAQVDEDEATRMVDVCREAGITMFDTSNNYAGGRSEEILGRIVKPFRDEVLISTKGGSHV